MVKLKKYNEAISDYSTALNLSPSNIILYFERGQSFTLQGNY